MLLHIDKTFDFESEALGFIGFFRADVVFYASEEPDVEHVWLVAIRFEGTEWHDLPRPLLIDNGQLLDTARSELAVIYCNEGVLT